MTERAYRRPRRPSGFRAEIQRTSALLERWITHELNSYFDLTVRGRGYREIRTVVAVLAIGVLAFVIHMLIAVNQISAPSAPMPLAAVIEAGLITAVRTALILAIAILFGLQVAGEFLADIFEVRDTRIAWDFLQRLVSGKGRSVLHLREGRIAEEDRNSPLLVIGGPGYVVTDNDTVALFELPDGTPHVVGPGIESDGKGQIVLTGFERLREPVVSLRDQYIGSLGGTPMEVVSRSLDGIPISAVDVRGVYSLRRKASEADADLPGSPPYPFDPEALEQLVYNQAVRVLTDGPHPSGEPGGWSATMNELIHDSLAEFMSHSKLGEYVAGVGEKEVELAEFREDTILSQTIRLSSEMTEPGTSSEPPRPAFHSRTELTARFLSEDEDFASRAGKYGLQLHWIGVGTWRVPDEASSEAVRQKHMDAWRLHLETTARADPKALATAAETAAVEEKLRLMREVPITSHQRNQERYRDKDVLIECLLQDFWEQMGDTLNVCYDNGPLSPEQQKLEQAVAAIEDLLKIRQLGYLVGGGSMSRVRRKVAKEDAPPAPSSLSEADRYRALLTKLAGDTRAAEGMIANESKRHRGLTREQLIQRILIRFERYGH